MEPAWMINELAHAGDEHLDTQYVKSYDEKAGTDPDEDLTVLLNLGLNDSHTLIDFGAGTGTFALAVAKVCKQVIATDISLAMVNVLKHKIKEQNVSNIECKHASFLTYQHQGDKLDFIYTRHALHHLPDFWKALALSRMASILKAGGILYLRDLVYSCELSEIEDVLEMWFNTAPVDSQNGWTRSELETHVREEHSTFSWLLEAMIERAGFEIQDVQHSSTRVHSAYVCVKK